MDFRALQTFIRIAELGSFGRAADALHQTQPTISRQVAALERQLGGRLFVRHRHGARLTAAGILFRDRAAQALLTLEQAKAEIAAQSETPSGPVSLGLPPSLLRILSGPVVEQFARNHPKVLLHVHEVISQGLEDLMRTGQVDLAVLISDRRQLRNVTLSPLASEPLMLAGPANSGLDPRRPVSTDAIAGLPLLSFRPPNYFRAAVESAIRRRGLPFTVKTELETLPLMIELVERGAGYTVLPASGLAGLATSIKLAPVRGLSVTWMLGINRDRANRPAVRIMAETIQKQAAAVIASGAWKAPRR